LFNLLLFGNNKAEVYVIHSHLLKRYIMLKAYIKIAWRNLLKNRVFSLINIFGLSVGIALTLLIGAYVWGELQVNHQLKNADNQYMILSKWKDPNMGNEFTSIAELPKTLKADYPGLVADYYRSDLISSTTVSKGDKHYRENLQIGDSTLLKMYGFTLAAGDVRTALNDPFDVVITKKVALKYFGNTNIIGQSLNVEGFSGDNHDFLIKGVLDETHRTTVTSLNTDYNLFFSAAAEKFFKRDFEGWAYSGLQTYVELQKGVDPGAVDKVMQLLLRKNAPEQISKNLTPYLVPLKKYNLVANGGVIKKMTYTLTCIAIFILLMAVINFVNICIGRSSGRMKEMGIRKVVGGLRKQIIWQFLVESIFMTILATVLALILYAVGRSFFSDVLNREIMSLPAFPLYAIPVLFLFALSVGLIAGIYPAIVLSALNSIDSLKGKSNSVKESVLFRKTLVAFQFATAAVVLIGAIIITQQINLFFSNNLGYNKDYVIYAQVPRDFSSAGVKKMEDIGDQLAQMSQVSNIALSYEIPNGHNGGSSLGYRQGANPSQAITSQAMVADHQYAAVYNLALKAGTFFKPVYYTADSTQIVINATASRAFGWNDPKDAIGQSIVYKGIPYTICGVVADFHFGSMQTGIPPMTFFNVNYIAAYRYFSIRVNAGDMQKNLAALQKKWVELLPGAPFEYHFMDDALKKLYSTELQLKKAAYIATSLAIIIVVLGILGLISLSIQKRTREIGIRKVLGSSVAGIITLFLKDFLGVAFIAGLTACPLAWLIMRGWLNDYAYKIDISISPFIISIGALTSITIILIILQTIKSALSSPIKSLKSE
jgi:putative ABC transport system permease protein